MRGHVDKIGNAGVSGWALDPLSPSRRVEIRLVSGKEVLGSVPANLARPDVGAITRTDGSHGFQFDASYLAKVSAKDLKKLGVEALGPNNEWVAIPNPSVKAGSPKSPQYQSFDDAEGASKSSAKLQALRLDMLPNRHSEATPLQGLSVLDLGCNEGFFCGEALRQGATRVVGIDASLDYTTRARTRFPKAEFLRGSWWDIPNEKFDVIFFLSAIHYEWKQREFLEKLATHLTPTGTLVLECGIGQSTDSNWYVIQRGDGIMRYPNFDMLSEELLKPYAWRYCGSSVQQIGDPVARSVLHCQLKKQTAIIVTGSSGSGKTTLALGLKGHGFPVFHTDGLIKSILEQKRYDWSPVAPAIRNAHSGTDIDCKAIGDAVVKAGLSEHFSELVMLEAFLEADISVIEGEILRHSEVLDSLTAKLKSKNIKTWSAHPQ